MKKYILAALALSLTGCSLDASLDMINKVVDTPILQKSQGAEFVSGSTQYVKTSGSAGAGRYEVQASVGNWHGDTMVTTTRGYTVFTSVQGQMISEEEGH